MMTSRRPFTGASFRVRTRKILQARNGPILLRMGIPSEETPRVSRWPKCAPLGERQPTKASTPWCLKLDLCLSTQSSTIPAALCAGSSGRTGVHHAPAQHAASMPRSNARITDPGVSFLRVGNALPRQSRRRIEKPITPMERDGFERAGSPWGVTRRRQARMTVPSLGDP